MANLTHHLHDGVWIDKQLAKIPEDFHAIVRSQYADRYLSNTDTQTEGERRRNTNLWFRETINSLTLASGDKRLEAKHRLALTAAKMLQIADLDTTAEWARGQGVRVPTYPKVETDPHKPNSQAAVKSRLCSVEWWDAQRTKKHRRDAEAAQIRAGNVSKDASPYASQEAVDNYQYRQTLLEAWKKQAVLISNEGDEISLDDADSEHTAAFIKFAEFMVRVNEMSAIASDDYVSADIVDALPEHMTTGKRGGALADLPELNVFASAEPESWVGVFFTLTTPSRFHRYSTRTNSTLELNRNYDPSKTPADARDWLQETWKLTQTAWKRKTKHIRPIDGYGFRMDETHHDGVSHYHYAIWVKSKDVQRAVEIFYNKALRGAHTDRLTKKGACVYGLARDATERGANERRLSFKIMTSAAGMVSYMVKYITKGLTGADWDDLQAGVPSDQTIIKIMARKSVWGLRQYAFWNAPSVMAWRELRRITDAQENPLLESARQAAHAKDWKAYTEINGGAACSARERPIRMMRQPKQDAETATDAHNQYGEVINQVRGLLVEDAEIRTRLKDWYLLNIGSLNKLLVQKFLRESDTKKSDLSPTFSDDIQGVIDQAKTQGKLHKLAERAGIVMFSPSSSSSLGGSPPLGLVGTTSHAQRIGGDV
ncbi:replication endonuclease [Thiothrix winogradskyi]|uniref:Replication endonuclease n=1 Tax=Thiothrix winogradskyi TaxID=96472 RepID=A0ABY3SXJ7_9GAMM|nr:replication endonuclease [Thiothrix winogradskyi]UJS23364.1 replication endonuclease [Thiothrix winogradskyi]